MDIRMKIKKLGDSPAVHEIMARLRLNTAADRTAAAITALFLAPICRIVLPYFSSGAARCIIMLLPVLLSGGVMLTVCARAEDGSRVRDISAAVFAAALVSSFYMSRRFFYVGEDGGAAAACAVLLLAVVMYAARSVGTFVTYAALCAILLGASPTVGQGRIYLLLMLAAVPLGADIIRENRLSAASQIFLWVCSTAPLIYLMQHPDRSAYGVWMLMIYAYLMILVMLDRRVYGRDTPFYLRPMGIIGFGGVLMLLISASRSSRWDSSVIAGVDWDINVLLFIMTVVLCLIYIESVLRGGMSLSSFMMYALFYAVGGMYIAIEFYRTTTIQTMRTVTLAAAAAVLLILLFGAFKRRDRRFMAITAAVGAFCLYEAVIVQQKSFSDTAMLAGFLAVTALAAVYSIAADMRGGGKHE